MDSQSQIVLQRECDRACLDFESFLLTQVLHSWLQMMPDGTLEILVTKWRERAEHNFTVQRRAIAMQTGVIQNTEDAERLILDTTVEMIRRSFGEAASPSSEIANEAGAE